MAPNEDHQPYLMGRSIITGAPLLFPLHQQDQLSRKIEKLELLESGGKGEEEESRFSTAIYQILERVENKLLAEEHQSRFGFSSVVEKSASGGETALWVDKYQPKRFTQLLTMDSCNLDVLRWIKQWDAVNDRFDRSSKEESNKSQPSKQSNKQATRLAKPTDSYGRPERKILLLHGPPGLGKTTLAHIAAQTAGYSVVEINASDERSGNSVINKISAAIEVKAVFSQDAKPNLVVIDEIDGAAAAGNEQSLINYLVKLASGSSGGRENSGKKTASSSASSINDKLLVRPIICICNDLYVPALRPLRQVAHIIPIKPISPSGLSSRLRSICEAEGLKINTRSLLDLAEAMDSDIRSSLNALQFLHARQSGMTSTAAFQKDLSFASFKDTAKSPLKLYESVFFSQKQQNNNKPNARPYSQLITDVWTSGQDVDRLLAGCFELYPDAKFFDNNTLDRVNAGLECFSGADLISNPRHLPPGAVEQASLLQFYAMYSLAQLKALFSSPVPNQSIQYKYPKQDYENHLKHQACLAVLKDYCGHLSPAIKSVFSKDALLMERLPVVLTLCLDSLPLIKSSNPQLMRPDDRRRLDRVVQGMLQEGLLLRQSKIPDSATYKYLLDPPLDTLLPSNTSTTWKSFSDPSTPQDSHSYALCRLIGNEMEVARIRCGKRGGDVDSLKANANASDDLTSKKRPNTTIVPASKKVARDFFGRPIVVDEVKEESGQDSKAVPVKESTSNKQLIWYVQNDGVSNAVRRSLKVQSFMMQ